MSKKSPKKRKRRKSKYKADKNFPVLPRNLTRKDLEFAFNRIKSYSPDGTVYIPNPYTECTRYKANKLKIELYRLGALVPLEKPKPTGSNVIKVTVNDDFKFE